jgi:hypothetical protein
MHQSKQTTNWVLYSVFTDKPERTCHFPAPGRNCMTHRQALQDFPDTSQVSLHKNKINLPFQKTCWKLCPSDSCVPVYQWKHWIIQILPVIRVSSPLPKKDLLQFFTREMFKKRSAWWTDSEAECNTTRSRGRSSEKRSRLNTRTSNYRCIASAWHTLNRPSWGELAARPSPNIITWIY